jgi:predicted metal-binding protein
MPSLKAGQPATTIFVCTTCRRGTEALEPLESRSGFRLHALVAEALAAGDPERRLGVQPVACLSNCSEGCNAAFAAPGKWTYVVGNLDPETDIAAILAFARQHRDHPEGVPVWRDRPECIRKGVAARVPPLDPAPPRDEERAAP